MQTANDDMDSLMRKAGVDYPLYTGSADWSKVANALETKVDTPLPKKNYGKYLGLILVFLLPWFLTQFDSQNQSGKGTVASSESGREEKSTPLQNEVVADQMPEETIQTGRRDAGNLPSESITYSNPVQTNTGINNGFTQSNKIYRSNEIKDPIQKSGQATRRSASPKNADQIAEADKKVQTNTAIAGSLPEKNASEVNSTEKINQVESPADQPINKEETETVVTPAVPTISTQPRKKFYIGLVGGMNLTTIKMQEVKDVGSDFGFIAGYKFSKGWSIEAGILSSSKNYYSDGEYLNNPKIYLPPNTEITAVQGDCRMIELPIVLKYDFGFKKAHNWFATAGVSSFLMKQEDYAYDYYYTLSGTTHTYSKTYENESKDWAAVLQISGGYMRSIPFGMNLRVEPFIQIPLKGAGYGNLPLTSAGLRLGITRVMF